MIIVEQDTVFHVLTSHRENNTTDNVHKHSDNEMTEFAGQFGKEICQGMLNQVLMDI